MDGWSLHFAVHPSISLSAKIHLDVMIEEGAQEKLEAEPFGTRNKVPRSRAFASLTENFQGGNCPPEIC